MQKSYLNKLYFLFATGEIKRDDFEGLIYHYLFNNQEKTCLCHWSRDEYEDYVSWIYPRLKKAIDSFRERGSSFDAFIGKVLHVTGKEYNIQTTTRGVTEYSAWSVQVPELYAYEESPVYLFEKKENDISKKIIDNHIFKNPKQLLALVLKCYYYISDDFLDRIASKTGIKREELKEMVDKLRAKRQKKDDELYRMKERIYSQYYRCIVYEKRLSNMPENQVIINRLKLRLEKARARLESMRKRIAKIRTGATNREVAEVIGISKGAVDASLYNLKTKWSLLVDRSLLN